MRIEYSDEWKEWIKYPLPEGVYAYTFPIYDPIKNVWWVFKPTTSNTEDYMEVPNKEYIEQHNARL